MTKKTDTARADAKASIAEAKRVAEAKARAERRRATVGWLVVGVVLLGLVAALIAFIVREGDVSKVSGDGQLTPAAASEAGGFGVGKSGVVGRDLDPARVQVDVYFDFICPACGYLERTQAATLATLREAGVIDLYYHPLAYFDDKSLGTAYSSRASSAAALVAEAAPEAFVPFVDLLFANQPSEGTAGLSDEEIQALATDAGVPDDVVKRIADHEYTSWARVATEQASARGVHSTPMIAVNGDLQDPEADPDDLEWYVEGELEAFLRDAALPE